jgi:hypothetical protein
MRMSFTATIIWKGTRIEEVANQNAGRVAEHGVGGFAATPQIRSVDDIVMKQGGRMNELDHGRQFVVMLAAVTQRAGGKQHQSRTQSLAATLDDVLGDLPDQHHVGMQALADHRVNGQHV